MGIENSDTSNNMNLEYISRQLANMNCQ